MTHSDDADEEELDQQEGRGRSARKREVKTFDVLAAQLIGLTVEQCKRLPVTAQLKEALKDAQLTKAKAARRRFARHVASLLRDSDVEVEAIRNFLAGDAYTRVTGDESYRDLNVLREQLCQAEMFELSFKNVCEELPHVDFALVRRLAERLHQGEDDKAYRALFRELRRAADESELDTDSD